MRIVIDIQETKLADAINAKVDIPYVPEAVEARAFREGVSAGGRAAAELIGNYTNEYIKVTVE